MTSVSRIADTVVKLLLPGGPERAAPMTQPFPEGGISSGRQHTTATIPHPAEGNEPAARNATRSCSNQSVAHTENDGYVFVRWHLGRPFRPRVQCRYLPVDGRDVNQTCRCRQRNTRHARRVVELGQRSIRAQGQLARGYFQPRSPEERR